MNRALLARILRASLALVSLVSVSSPISFASDASAPAPSAGATAGERTRQEIVVTNQNLALVLETRRATIPAGEVELAWPGAAPTVRPETWSLVNSGETGVRWLGLFAPPREESGLSGLVGRRVRIERREGAAAEGEVVAVYGTTADQVLFREGDDLVYGEPGARISIPGGAREAGGSAGVRLRLSADRAGDRELTSRYLVGNLGWQANYALTLASDEKSARLEGAFTIDNAAGADFAPTRLRLLAGQLRIASAPGPPMPMAARAESLKVSSDESFVSEAASESRIYEIPNPRRLPRGRTSVSTVDGAVSTEKHYVASFSVWPGESPEPQPLPVAVRYGVGASKLAAALPAGVVRVYAGAGGLFTGEDRIAHTPERTDFEIESSEAFDLAARRRAAGGRQISPRETEAEEEITLTSRKKESVKVLVRGSFPGEWQILESSVPARRTSSSTAEFVVPVPAGAQAVLKLRVRFRLPG